jgi:uncharacterized protein involved in exopolysaccharide biosynthesis
MTKRQEALDAMSMLLQSNPQLWAVAGDLFIKNMDWPGAQEMAKRFAKIIDPKVMDGEDQSPEMAAAKQQLEALTQELNRMTDMIQHIQDGMEAQKIETDKFKAEIQAYDAETKRISAVQNSMTPEQIQDIVMGTIAAAIDTGDLIGNLPEREEMMGEEPFEMQESPEMLQMPAPTGEMPPEMVPTP